METDQSMGKFDQWQKICLAILDNGFVVSCPNVTKWTEWMEESFPDGSHWIATDDIQGFRVETVFLGINHNIPGIEPPLWFESMVYRESADGTHGVRIKYDTLRYSSERIRSKWGATPIILISGYDPSAVALRAEKLHIFDFLEKPFSREIICNAVKKAIGSPKRASELSKATHRSLRWRPNAPSLVFASVTNMCTVITRCPGQLRAT